MTGGPNYSKILLKEVTIVPKMSICTMLGSHV